MSPGFTLSIYPHNPEIVAVHGLSRTVITLPAPETATISISANRQKILEKKHKNFKFATRAGEQETRRIRAGLTGNSDRGARFRALFASHECHGFNVGSFSFFFFSLYSSGCPEGKKKLICDMKRNTPNEAVRI